MEPEPVSTSREKSPLPEKFSPEEDRTHDAASSRTASPTHYHRAIPVSCCPPKLAPYLLTLRSVLANNPTTSQHPYSPEKPDLARGSRPQHHALGLGQRPAIDEKLYGIRRGKGPNTAAEHRRKKGEVSEGEVKYCGCGERCETYTCTLPCGCQQTDDCTARMWDVHMYTALWLSTDC